MTKKITIPQILEKNNAGEKLVVVTAYDYPTAQIADSCGVDILLVGDSLGNVVLGYGSTTPVTMEDMLHHTKAVVRGTKNALVVADMPYGSYQVNNTEAVRNAIRFIKEGGADAVKLEGGLEAVGVVKALTNAGIPVMAHIGLLPQTAMLWGGYRIQGKDEAAARILVDAAQALEEAGAFSIVLELVTSDVARLVTEKTEIPTIGIGSGVGCNGQVLVIHDLAGFHPEGAYTPHFVKQFGNVGAELAKAVSGYAQEVRAGSYPDDAHSFAMNEEEVKKLY